MTNETRNRRFTRKSSPKGRNIGENERPARRSAGMRTPASVQVPESPKASRKSDKGRQRGSHDQRGQKGRGREGGAGWIWGLHAVKAVFANPSRTIHDILITENTLSRLDLPDNAPAPKVVAPALLDRDFGHGHQGVAVKAAPLEWPELETFAHSDAGDGLLLVLDQITDPHNVGAMLRLCSAFGVSALVMQTRNAPPLSGAVAKVAVGCVETVPVCLVTNIANTLQYLQKQNWRVTGLAGETDLTLSQALSGGGKHVLVMGAEGPGLRSRVRENCDQLARIPMMSSNIAGEAESLNVATAAAIALYEVRRG